MGEIEVEMEIIVQSKVVFYGGMRKSLFSDLFPPFLKNTNWGML